MKDKFGNKLTTKEFFSRWKEGIKSVTPLQQVKISLMGNLFVVVGVIIGLITTFILKTWWLFIILCGSFFLTSMACLANFQKYIILKEINERRLKNDE